MTQTLLRLSTAALGLGLAAPAAADLVFENNRGGSVELYGQFNPSVTSVDDGFDSFSEFADSDTSNSRVGIRYEQPFGDLTFRFRGELALGLPLTSEFDQTGFLDAGTGWTRSDIRHVDFSLQGRFGRVFFGQGSMAGDGVAEIALGGTGGFIYQYVGDGNGAFRFRQPGEVAGTFVGDPADTISGPAVEDVFDNFDGSRRGRIKYETPEFGGFKAQIAYGENWLSSGDDDTYFDIAGLYAGEFGNGIEFEAGVAYQMRDRDQSEDTTSWIGSASMLLTNGISFSAGFGTQTDDRAGRSDPSWYSLGAGYDANFIAAGPTSFGIQYWSGSDYTVTGSDSEAWSIGVQQDFERINTEVYLAYHNQSFDDGTGTTNYADMSNILFGARWRF